MQKNAWLKRNTVHVYFEREHAHTHVSSAKGAESQGASLWGEEGGEGVTTIYPGRLCAHATSLFLWATDA